MTAIASRQVAWWPVHEFITAVVAQANYAALPVAGTPAWCELADGNPQKLLALAVAGEHHALRMETAQQALAEASHGIAGAADWPAVGREMAQLNAFYAERPWLRRKGVA